MKKKQSSCENEGKPYLEIFQNQKRKKKNKLLSWKVYISVNDKRRYFWLFNVQEICKQETKGILKYENGIENQEE